MSGPDVRSFLRLKGAIDTAASSIPEGQIAAAGNAYKDMYERFRPQIREAIADELWDEFDTSFPEEPQWRQGTRAGGRLLAAGVEANQAKALLHSLSGWLQGHIDGLLLEARIKAEAEAYAARRVKTERGVGFKPPGNCPP